MIYVDPMPTEQQIGAFYEGYDSGKSYRAKARKKILTATYKQKLVTKYLPPGQRRFLDIGCSIGAVCEAARRQGFEATGIDLDETALTHARELFPGCRFEHKTSDALAADGAKFELLFCTEVLEHVPHPHEFVASFRDLLVDGGILYLTTPDAGHWKVPADIFEWNMVIPPEHLALYNRDNLARLFDQHDLEVIRFRWCHRANLRVIARARSRKRAH